MVLTSAAADGGTREIRTAPHWVRIRPLREGFVKKEGEARSDGDILLAVKAGDKRAYREVVDRYKHRAYRIAVGLVGEPQDALDISQMAFIKAYRNLKHFEEHRPFFPWFYRILKNLCLDHLKHSSRTREVPLEDMDTLSQEEGETETREVLWRAIENLPLEQREVITLHYFGGFKYKEIAKSLEIPIGTVMSSLYYARKKLKAELSGVLGFRSSGEV